MLSDLKANKKPSFIFGYLLLNQGGVPLTWVSGPGFIFACSTKCYYPDMDKAAESFTWLDGKLILSLHSLRVLFFSHFFPAAPTCHGMTLRQKPCPCFLSRQPVILCVTGQAGVLRKGLIICTYGESHVACCHCICIIVDFPCITFLSRLLSIH